MSFNAMKDTSEVNSKIMVFNNTAVSCRLEIRQAGEGRHHVPGLVEAHVKNMNDV
ncbi:hypothetical protein RchiOBHm_Chr4g0387911 [Rosa chinensis]|uniref:Uncharacterized protein n=1 Tax=Rosa chinensis TaxID=74649 RepID=A0A2P6QPP9_ROSCH|nr:hypothetical protein RchiOBHm_Chr4g0387911 [Rosa chinensis]